jgi:carbon-monoxide dehydrogenase small subunit
MFDKALVERGAVQCGFCTPGMVVAAHALLSRIPNPSEMQIREAMAGNICRCTGYKRIVEAVQAVAASKAQVQR